MKNYLSILFCLSVLVGFAQKPKVVVAEYDLTFNTEYPFGITSQIYIDPTTQNVLYVQDYTRRREIGENPVVEQVDEGTVKMSINLGGKSKKYALYNSANDSIFAQVQIHRDVYLLTERKPLIQWDLAHTETKTIGEYTAKKATAYFRGRNYTAWYTPEVPINHGPFKFHGLPGLILHIADDTQTYVWSLRALSEVDDFPEVDKIENFLSLPQIDSREYVDKKFVNPSAAIDVAKLQASAPRGVKIASVSSTYRKSRYGIEIKFEWEEEDEQE